MELIRPGTNWDFIGKRKIAYVISGALLLMTLIALFVKGPNYGVDFAGGSLIQIKFTAPVEISKIKDGLQTIGIENATVQSIGKQDDHEYLVRTDATHVSGEQFIPDLAKALETATGARVEIRRVEMVGPQVGTDLREKALLAIFFSLLFIAIYISGRFELKWVRSGLVAVSLGGFVYLIYTMGGSLIILIWAVLLAALVLFWVLGLKYALGAVVSLIHDVAITVGLFIVLEKEITLTVIAALLTIIGYSLNDCIVVYDRIRENLRKMSKSPLADIINRSVNETLSRTILTGGAVIIVLVVLLFIGGDILHDFAFALLVGVLVGTFSSVYVAGPIVLSWEEHARKK